MVNQSLTIPKPKPQTDIAEPTQFPDFPPREDMQNWQFLYRRSLLGAIATHLGSRDDTLVGSEIPVGPNVRNRADIRIPDLVVAFNCDVKRVLAARGYSIDAHGKPPAFALEVASESTGDVDYTVKRVIYARYGVREYWRFDETGGDYHDVALAGDVLVNGEYKPIPIEWVDDEIARGYSEVLRLYICWEYGDLRFYDPEREVYLITYEENAAARRQSDARAVEEAEARRQSDARADRSDARAEEEAEARRQADARAEAEAEARHQAQARAEEESARAEAEAEARRQSDARAEEEAEARRQAQARADEEAARADEEAARAEEEAEARRQIAAENRRLMQLIRELRGEE